MENTIVKERNQTIQWLKALMIIMVIDDHVGTRIGILSSIFPYNSFYMPAFVFISGYLYKNKGLRATFIKNTKRILLPYQIWSFAGLLVSYLLMKGFKLQWYRPIDGRGLISSLYYGPLSTATGPSWFAITLFWVTVIYSILYHNRAKVYIDVLYSVVLLGLSIATVTLIRSGFLQYEYGLFNWRLYISRIAFLLFFFHMGGVFKRYFEVHVKKVSGFYICAVCICVNIILIANWGNLIEFPALQNMNGFHSIVLPYITTITGILFWYTACAFLAERSRKVKIINYIADHTFTIMCSHLLFLNIPNLYVYLMRHIENGLYVDFEEKLFIANAWYRYSSNCRIVAFVFGIVGSLTICIILDRIKDEFHKRKQQL